MRNGTPYANDSSRTTGRCALGMRVKSGQSLPLKRLRRRVEVAPFEAWTVTGWRRRPTMRSARSGTSFTWSRWAWVTRTWSTRSSSASPRREVSAPASSARRSSTRKQVLPWPRSSPPDAPSTRIFTDASPVGVRNRPGALRPGQQPRALQRAQDVGRLLGVHVEPGGEVLGGEMEERPGTARRLAGDEVDHPGAGVPEEQVLDLPVGLGQASGHLLDHAHRDLGAGAYHGLEGPGVDDEQEAVLDAGGRGRAGSAVQDRHLPEELPLSQRGEDHLDGPDPGGDGD